MAAPWVRRCVAAALREPVDALLRAPLGSLGPNRKSFGGSATSVRALVAHGAPPGCAPHPPSGALPRGTLAPPGPVPHNERLLLSEVCGSIPRDPKQVLARAPGGTPPAVYRGSTLPWAEALLHSCGLPAWEGSPLKRSPSFHPLSPHSTEELQSTGACHPRGAGQRPAGVEGGVGAQGNYLGAPGQLMVGAPERTHRDWGLDAGWEAMVRKVTQGHSGMEGPRNIEGEEGWKRAGGRRGGDQSDGVTWSEGAEGMRRGREAIERAYRGENGYSAEGGSRREEGVVEGVWECGRGDKRTKKGKRFKGSFGNARATKKRRNKRLRDKWEYTTPVFPDHPAVPASIVPPKPKELE